jgi:methyl-accepting chemotaxis protein
MQGAGAAVEEIMQHIQSIASDINQIAAGSEEQSATIQEFTSGIISVAEAAEVTRAHAQQTGEGIYDLSQKLGQIRLKSLSNLPDPNTYQALEFSKTDHYLWTWRIYNMLLGYEHIDPNSVGNHHDCRLGRWAESSHANSLHSHPLFQKLEAPHKLVHDYAYEAALAYQAKDMMKVEQILDAMSQASKEVVEILEGLQKIV